jgi:hypothetical protein
MNIPEQLNQILATVRRTFDKTVDGADLAVSSLPANRTPRQPRWQFNFELDGTVLHGAGALRLGGGGADRTTASAIEGDDRPSAELGTKTPRAHGTDQSLPNQVDASLRRYLEVESIHHDDNGDVRIRSGDAAVFVRVLPQEELVAIFSPVVSNVRKSPSLLRAVNDMNGELRLTRALIAGSEVIVATEVPGGAGVDAAVPIACDAVALASNE